MKVTEKTKISELIKHNIETIDAIASVNSHFTKLKNPILRKLLASRVTLLEAAKIGKCDVSVLIEKLKPLGFEFDSFNIKTNLETKNKSLRPDKVNLAIDVRPMLEKGHDPFKLIMTSLKETDIGDTIEIISSFEPVPLIRVLEQNKHKCISIENDGIFSLFITKGNETIPQNKQTEKNNKINEVSFEEFNNKLNLFIEKNLLNKIDVHGLEMPMPMITILENIEKIDDKGALFVNHFQIPQFLIPELEKRNYCMKYYKKDENQVHLLIFK